MVFEKPLIDTRELMRALDPVHGRDEREYRRLQQARLLSGGVTGWDPRHRSSSQRLTLYCSLNRDAISAVRRGHPDAARELRAHAERIEQDTLAPWLATIRESWAEAEVEDVELDDSGGGSVSWIDHMLFPTFRPGATEIADPVWDAAREVAEIRTRFEAESPSVRLTIGRVWRIDDALSEVRPELPSLDESFAFSADEVLEAGLRLGDPVVIRHEELAPGVLLTTLERGLDRSVRTSRLTAQPLPPNIDGILEDSALSERHHVVGRPLRYVA